MKLHSRCVRCHPQVGSRSYQELDVRLRSSTWGCCFPSLFVCRQDRQVSCLVRLAELGEQAREVERLPAERDRPVPARPLAGVAVPGQLIDQP